MAIAHAAGHRIDKWGEADQVPKAPCEWVAGSDYYETGKRQRVRRLWWPQNTKSLSMPYLCQPARMAGTLLVLPIYSHFGEISSVGACDACLSWEGLFIRLPPPLLLHRLPLVSSTYYCYPASVSLSCSLSLPNNGVQPPLQGLRCHHTRFIHTICRRRLVERLSLLICLIMHTIHYRPHLGTNRPKQRYLTKCHPDQWLPTRSTSEDEGRRLCRLHRRQQPA